jgi:hypothetical protein
LELLLLVLAQKILEFVLETPTGRELSVDLYRMLRASLVRLHARTVVAQQERASLGNTSEKPVFQPAYNIHTSQNCFKFNSATPASSDLALSTVLTVYGALQYTLNATMWVQYPARLPETSGETWRLQVTIGHGALMSFHAGDIALAWPCQTPEDSGAVHSTSPNVPDSLDLTVTLDLTPVVNSSEVCAGTRLPRVPEK